MLNLKKKYNKINLLIKIFIIKFIWNKFQMIKKLIKDTEDTKRYMTNLFTKDNVMDLDNYSELFRQYSNNYNKKITKLNKKYFYWFNKLNLLLFKYKLLEDKVYESFVVNCVKLHIKPEKIEFIKDIIIFYIK